MNKLPVYPYLALLNCLYDFYNSDPEKPEFVLQRYRNRYYTILG